ncbi:biotin transporter BioY [Alicyclobacillus cycloheptanicus]|uniref:Biotin transporter n=1 Tax=Alicyclobacillus cycloheptanicus TaxID=1457 RepID=A0ABT9XG66_9BACL|nr:biotin transporter BioY [Alicyclobacillus cycloheptanicus]MDQ0189125.1 biotin transport system substrate-specific component [Alicyclobacillus cycloheptanicus]WDM00253.1 biotin transporter BioY [Alicyclobacillus cycloheptanicus]
MSRITVQGIVFSALFAALTVVLDFLQVNLGFTPVPITLGNMGIMLAGAILGGGYGFFSILLLVVLTLIGLPLLDGSGGIGVFASASGGYVMAWPICALVTGLVVSRIKGNGPIAFAKIFISIELFSTFLCYVGGVPWLMHVLHVPLQKALVLGMYPYLIGDTLKAFVTALVVMPIRKLYPASRLTGRAGAKVATLPEEGA